MTGEIHLFVRAAEDGHAYATSPQAPGLLYGRESAEDLERDLQGALSFHFERPGPFQIIEHCERHHDIDGRELVIRMAIDDHQAERTAVCERIGHALNVPEQAESLLSAATNAVGETVYVCAVPSDTIGWLEAQLDPRGDAFVAALAIADGFLLALPFAVNDGTRSSWRPVTYGPATTLSEVMQRSTVVTPPQLARLELC
jgi:hypothetical protein